jgi:hypothetical protein
MKELESLDNQSKIVSHICIGKIPYLINWFVNMKFVV